MRALPALKPQVEVHGLIAATENMPSGAAIRPGDVLRAMNGTTIEIGNTDAEGRLTLADGICYAIQKINADEIVDMATLTGACVVALGPLVSGLFANNDDLAKRLMTAAAAAGERVWRLPLVDEYRENLKSDVADMNNAGGRAAAARSPPGCSSRSSPATGRGRTSTSPARRSSRRTRRWRPRAAPAAPCARSSPISRTPAGSV